MLTEGTLQVFAIFDKPDPLDGPFFEETIYVTPSRAPRATQHAIVKPWRARPAHSDFITVPSTRNVASTLRESTYSRWLLVPSEASARRPFDSSHRMKGDHSRGGAPPARDRTVGLRIPSGDSRERRDDDSHSAAWGLSRGKRGRECPPRCGYRRRGDYGEARYDAGAFTRRRSYLGFIFGAGETAADVESALRNAHRMLDFSRLIAK